MTPDPRPQPPALDWLDEHGAALDGGVDEWLDNGANRRRFARRGNRLGRVAGWAVVAMLAAGAAVVGWRDQRPHPTTTVRAAPADALVAVSGADLPGIEPAPTSARMGGAGATVVLTSVGDIRSYGSSAHARAAPAGRRLLAFELAIAPGEISVTPLAALSLGLSIDGRSPRQLPIAAPGVSRTGQWFVAAIPARARSADLVLRDAGLVQRLSLLTARPAAGNIDVLRRPNLVSGSVAFGYTSAVVDDHGRRTAVRLAVNIGGAQLSFFTPQGIRPASVHDAFLTLDACLASDRFFDPLTCYPFHGTALTLRPDGGQPIRPQIVGSGSSRSGVFEVPAGFTSGVMTLQGTETGADGWRLSVTRPFSFPIRFDQ